MQYEQSRTWAEISLDNLIYNYQKLSNLVGPSCDIMTVVKANAYGHGAVHVSHEIQESGGKFLGVSTIQEAMELRENNITIPILILGTISPMYTAIAFKNDITIAIFDYEYARKISDAAVEKGGKLNVHIKVDTGLARFGISIHKNMKKAIEETLRIAELPGIKLSGVFTHFAVGGDKTQDNYSLMQLNHFNTYADTLLNKGLKLLRHCANSPVTLRFPQARFDMVRLGTLIYGMNPFGFNLDLKPIMELKSRIMSIRYLDIDDSIGYDKMFTAQRLSKIALIPFGYADGVHRCCSNQAHVLVNGKRVKLIGKIGMDISFADITDVPEVKVDDVVTIFGQDQDEFISVYEYTNLYPGSAPELTCMLGRRVPKFYIKGGEIVAKSEV